MHQFNGFIHLVRDALQGRPDNVGLGGSAVHPHNGRPGICRPIGGAQPDEGRNQINPFVIGHLVEQLLHFLEAAE
ncbi:hypothetical protein D3C81_2084980 [compost metagenome]